MKVSRSRFSFFDEENTLWSDGLYRWELSASPKLSDEVKQLMLAARNDTSIADPGQFLRDNGVLAEVEHPLTQSGTFRLHEGSAVREAVEPTPSAQPQPQPQQAAAVSDRDLDVESSPTLSNGVQLRDRDVEDEGSGVEIDPVAFTHTGDVRIDGSWRLDMIPHPAAVSVLIP